MEFYYIRFLAVWIVWLLVADKKRWRELLPVGMCGSLLGSFTDLIMQFYPLWTFEKNISPIPYLLWDCGMYPVTIYLFIQWLPKHQTVLRMLFYWLCWSTFALLFEMWHLNLGRMEHHQWWTLIHSLFANLILFTVFYYYHKIFQFEKLSKS